nr:hypothetical protein Iba_chr12aCG6810 [Ipomoea batatas]
MATSIICVNQRTSMDVPRLLFSFRVHSRKLLLSFWLRMSPVNASPEWTGLVMRGRLCLCPVTLFLNSSFASETDGFWQFGEGAFWCRFSASPEDPRPPELKFNIWIIEAFIVKLRNSSAMVPRVYTEISDCLLKLKRPVAVLGKGQRKLPRSVLGKNIRGLFLGGNGRSTSITLLSLQFKTLPRTSGKLPRPFHRTATGLWTYNLNQHTHHVEKFGEYRNLDPHLYTSKASPYRMPASGPHSTRSKNGALSNQGCRHSNPSSQSIECEQDTTSPARTSDIDNHTKCKGTPAGLTSFKRILALLIASGSYNNVHTKRQIVPVMAWDDCLLSNFYDFLDKTSQVITVPTYHYSSSAISPIVPVKRAPPPHSSFRGRRRSGPEQNLLQTGNGKRSNKRKAQQPRTTAGLRGNQEAASLPARNPILVFDAKLANQKQA